MYNGGKLLLQSMHLADTNLFKWAKLALSVTDQTNTRKLRSDAVESNQRTGGNVYVFELNLTLRKESDHLSWKKISTVRNFLPVLGGHISGIIQCVLVCVLLLLLNIVVFEMYPCQLHASKVLFLFIVSGSMNPLSYC